MRRPWVVMLTSFALVLGLGGLAFAAGGVPFIDDGPEAATADSREAELPDFDPKVPDRVEGFEKDIIEEPVKDEPVKDEPVKDEPVKDEVKEEEPKEGTEEVKDDPKAEPPELAILYPENGAKVDDEKMVFEGETTPGARVFAGKWEADVNDDGAWRIVLVLEPGTQTAKFRAESDGGVAEAAVTITRIVPDEPKEEPKEEPAYELVAHQVYGTCEEPVPYDVFYGETAPGAYVLVWSEYGSTETYANDKGEFEVRVDFPNAPYGQAFPVKVKSIDQKRYFEFVSYSPNSHDFVAYQVHGASEADVPHDVFWGETGPGEHVLVWSEYGSAEAYANEAGQFELGVEFPEAPYGVTFAVKVKSMGHKIWFEFTSYANPPEGGGEGA
ncbi:MAG: hypothetical protein KJN73_02080 [Acidimicrobiia bacterium]|nr:hypothetical protein [Acidimicrobiia bacterium]